VQEHGGAGKRTTCLKKGGGGKEKTLTEDVEVLSVSASIGTAKWTEGAERPHSQKKTSIGVGVQPVQETFTLSTPFSEHGTEVTGEGP